MIMVPIQPEQQEIVPLAFKMGLKRTASKPKVGEEHLLEVLALVYFPNAEDSSRDVGFCSCADDSEPIRIQREESAGLLHRILGVVVNLLPRRGVVSMGDLPISISEEDLPRGFHPALFRVTVGFFSAKYQLIALPGTIEQYQAEKALATALATEAPPCVASETAPAPVFA